MGDWPQIERELKSIGNIDSRDILDINQVNFTVNRIKISFLARQENLSPITNPVFNTQ